MFKILFFIVYSISLYPVEYIYPIAQAQDSIYLMYQKKEGIELLSWSPLTKALGKVLSLRFMPTGVRMLPDQSGFSFVDQGVLWLKSFLKRSPRHLDMNVPLSDIDLVYWKNRDSCYFSALYGDSHGLFELNIYGDLDCLVFSDNADCIYPQKINDTLFFLMYDKKAKSFSLMKGAYPDVYHVPLTFNTSDSFEQRVDQLCFDSETACLDPIVSFSSCSNLHIFEREVLFLTMINESEGFVLESASRYSLHFATYRYLHIRNKCNKWVCSSLFSFSVPLYLTKARYDDSNCLYESILPLLPRFSQETDQLYYSHFTEQGVTILCYDLQKNRSYRLAHYSHGLFFSPFYIGNGKLILGSSIDSSIKTQTYNHNFSSMWMDAKLKKVCLNLTTIYLNNYEF